MIRYTFIFEEQWPTRRKHRVSIVYYGVLCKVVLNKILKPELKNLAFYYYCKKISQVCLFKKSKNILELTSSPVDSVPSCMLGKNLLLPSPCID